MKKIYLIVLAALLGGGLLLWVTRGQSPVSVTPVAQVRDATGTTSDTAPPEQGLPAAPGGSAAPAATTAEDLGVTQTRRLAEQNDTAAQLALGERYLTGDGVPQNEAEALQWFQKAARLGDPTAQLKAGQMYENGQGTERNLDRAIVWYTKAAQNGDPAAQANLADMYEFGERIRSNKAAAYWNEQAANQGYAPSQLNLGRMYQTGTGVTQDNVEAYVWYAIAAASGDPAAATSRDQVSSRLTSEELAAARERVRQWQPKRSGQP